MKKVSKIISMILVVASVFSIFSINASAVATPLDAGNTKASATTIPKFGTEYVSELSVAGEEDWFKFTTLSDDAYYTIALDNYNIAESTTNGSYKYSLNLYIYDTYNKEIAHLYRSTTNTNIKLEKNTTYYIKVAMGSSMTGSTGNYDVFIDYKLDPVSNIKEEATSININNTYKYSLDGTSDVDWFKFTTFSEDADYTIALDNYNIAESSTNGSYKASLNLYIYDTYDKEITHLYRNTTNTNIQLEKNTTYYIKVAMGAEMKHSTGNYGFSVTCDSVKSLSNITITSMPNKTVYEIGDTFDKTGLVVTAHYSDGTSAKVTSYMVSGFDSSSEGTKTITVGYAEEGVLKTATFNVTVKAEVADDTVECGCGCHKSGISKFFFNLILFFQMLFGSNQICDCGVAHY